MTTDPWAAHHPFLAKEASSLGISERRLRSPEYRQVLHGVLIRADVPDTLVVRSRAALLLAPPGSVLSHWTAARLWGGTTPDDPWIHLTLLARSHVRVGGIRHHRHRHLLEITRRHGMPVTSPLQTFGHLARGTSLTDLVALGDSLVRKQRFSIPDLLAYTALWSGQCRHAAVAAARLVREGVDSAPETHLRLLMVLAGLVEPEVNIVIHDADGQVRYRLDLGFRAQRLAIEYDGRWHNTPEQQAHDEIRRAELRDQGWSFVVVTAEDLYGDPGVLLHCLATAMAEHGIPVPARFSDEWRPFFRCPTHVA